MIAVLFARRDSVYKTFEGCDVFDADRDALTFAGDMPVVAHPPCRAWGGLRKLAKPRDGEKELAIWAVGVVRKNGGVLEHPRGSTLWKHPFEGGGLPLPTDGADAFGGYTLDVCQHWWGHKAEKRTWLYIVGVPRSRLPQLPLVLGKGTHVITQSRSYNNTRFKKGMQGWRPEVTKAEREHTPAALAKWLVQLAGMVEARHG